MEPARVVVLAREAVDRLTTGQLRDALDAADPDAVLATWPGADVRLRAELPEADDLPRLVPGVDRTGATGDDPEPAVHALGDVDVVVASTDDEVAAIPRLEADGRFDPGGETYVLTDRLSLSVRPAALSTDLEGLDAYREALAGGPDCGAEDSADAGTVTDEPAADALGGPYTHLSTGIPAGYRRDWDGLVVRGAAPRGDVELTPAGPGSTDEPAVVVLTLGPDGSVADAEYPASSLGLRAVQGIGGSRADTLRAAGVRSRADLAEASVRDLVEHDGIGRTTGARLVERARAFEAGRVLRSGDEFFPRREPVFVDVETDGLSPSIVWLVGALDREAAEPYRSFLNRDPDEPGAALEAFLSWYAASADGRPVVAYNGLQFDFPVIEEQVDRHCPAYRETWASARTFDPYAWAVRDGNAVLPGRTNRLDDVAAAMGYESALADEGEGDSGGAEGDSGGAEGDSCGAALSGAEVARQYRAWMHADEERETEEPDWDRLRAYCEDDVRALAHVYDALDAAERTTGGVGRTSGQQTTQGSLGDY